MVLLKETECDLCAVWVERHGHLLKADGSVGLVIVTGKTLDLVLGIDEVLSDDNRRTN